MERQNLDRRRLAIIAGAAALIRPTLAGAEPGQFAGETLRVGTFGGTWADAIREAVGPQFEKVGAKLEFVTGNPQDNLAKVIAAKRRGEPPMDTFEILGGTVPQIMALDLLQHIDYGTVSNAKVLPPDQRQPKLAAIWTTQEMIVYSPKQFRELGLAAPTSLADLAGPK